MNAFANFLFVLIAASFFCKNASAELLKAEQYLAVDDYKNAIKELGHVDAADSLTAEFILGKIYLNEIESPLLKKDENLANKWFRKSLNQVRRQAEAGDPLSQTHLGHLLYGGYGVTKDKAKGLEWLHKAEAQNYPHAIFSLGDIQLGSASNSERAQGRARILRAASLGYANAQFRVAEYIRLGIIPGTLSDALKLNHQAADQGVLNAEMNLVWLYLQEDYFDFPKAVYWLHEVFIQTGEQHLLFDVRMSDLLYEDRLIKFKDSLDPMLYKFLYQESYKYLMRRNYETAAAHGKFIEAYSNNDPSQLVEKIKIKKLAKDIEFQKYLDKR